MTLTKKLGLVALLMTTAAPAFAFQDGKLVIWTGPNRDQASLAELTAKFTADLGVEVVIEEVDPLTDKFQQAAATGDGPDIVLWAHDRFGEWAAGGLIQPVNPSDELKAEQIGTAWDAVTAGDKIWGYPVAVEAIGLLYNKALVTTPPAAFEDIAAMETPEGVGKILWDYNNTYFTMPMLMAGGGFAFQQVDGIYDGTTTGVNTEGAIAGGDALKALFDAGVMAPGADYGVMDGAFAKGEVAMIINGPWSWANYTAAGIDVGVAPLPSVNGQASPPFLGVQALAINAASPNTDLAVEFIENYVLTDEGLATWNKNGGLGALTDISSGAAQTDPKIAATLANATIGIPMPSNPEMGAFWSAMGPALTNITTGAQAPADALNDAAKRILGE